MYPYDKFSVEQEENDIVISNDFVLYAVEQVKGSKQFESINLKLEPFTFDLVKNEILVPTGYPLKVGKTPT